MHTESIPKTDWKAECLRLMEKIVIDHKAAVHLIKTGKITPEQWAEAKQYAANPDPNGTKRPDATNLPPSFPAMPSESPGRVETAERGSERATGRFEANAKSDGSP